MGDTQTQPEKSTGQSFASAGAWTTSGKFVSKLIDLATLIILTNVLEPADFGLVAMAMVVILVIEAVTSIPIEAPILRLSAPSDDVYHTAFTLTVLRAVLILVVVGVLSQPLAVYYQDPRLIPLLLVLACAPALRGCASPRMADFVRVYNMRPEFIIDIASKSLSLVVGTVIAVLTKSYWAIAACTVATTIVIAVLSYYFAPYRPRFSLKSWGEYHDIVTWNTISEVFKTMTWQFDAFLLGRYLETKLFGQYSISRTLSHMPDQAIVQPVKLPMLRAFSSATTDERRRELWLVFSCGTFLCVGPILIILTMLSTEVTHVILGPGWEQSAVFLTGLAIAALPSLLAAPLDPLAISMFKTRLVAIRVIVQFAATIPFVTLAVIWFGVWGAIVARGTIDAAVTLYVFYLVRKHTGLQLRDQFQAMWRPLISLCVLAAFLYFGVQPFASITEQGRFAAFFLLTGVGLASLAFYFAVLLTLWFASGKPKTAEHHVWGVMARVFHGLSNKRAHT